MAFTCLTNLLGFKAKVKAVGNHSWSELLIPKADDSGAMINLVPEVDWEIPDIDWPNIETHWPWVDSKSNNVP